MAIGGFRHANEETPSAVGTAYGGAASALGGLGTIEVILMLAVEVGGMDLAGVRGLADPPDCLPISTIWRVGLAQTMFAGNSYLRMCRQLTG